VYQIICVYLIPTSHRTQSACTVNSSWLVLYGEIIGIYLETDTRHVNRIVGICIFWTLQHVLHIELPWGIKG